MYVMLLMWQKQQRASSNDSSDEWSLRELKKKWKIKEFSFEIALNFPSLEFATVSSARAYDLRHINVE